MIETLLQSVGAAAFVAALAAEVRRRGPRRVFGWLATANGFYLTADVLARDRFWAAVNGGAAVWAAWAWWHSGGGDGTRRRLKAWARRFRGVRRTAPVMGGAS